LEREVDEDAFRMEWERGTSIKAMARLFKMPVYLVHYFAGRLGLEPRWRLMKGRKVSSEFRLTLPAHLVRELGLSPGNLVSFKMVDKEQKIIQLIVL